MPFYAQLDNVNVVTGVSDLHTLVNAPHMILIESLDNSLLGSTYSDGVFTPAEPMPEVRRITKLALSIRLGVTAEVAIETAAASDPVVRVLLGRVSKASYVDLDDPLLEYGLRVFEDKGLMTSEQVTDVLSAPVLESEKP